MRRRSLLGETKPTILTCVYTVTSTTSPTIIGYNEYISGFSEIEIDGVEQPSVVSAYTFDTLGEHEVKYTLTNPIVIGIYSFSGCSSLISITIPNSVRSIEQYAFIRCHGLKRVNSTVNGECNIPNSVTIINARSFYECNGLTSLYIPSSVTSIGSNPWTNTFGLTSITVSSSNTVYDSRNNCNAIIRKSDNALIVGCKNTVIPNTVTLINQYAFYGCSVLTSISIPNSVTSIGVYAFDACSSLTSCTIGSGVTSIGNAAFYGCSSLTTIDIPNGVTSIGDNTFYGCSGLTSLYIPSSVTSIGTNPWNSCYGLTAITVDSNNAYYDSRNNCNAIIKKSNNELIAGCKNTVIPNSVTSIGNSAFSWCSGLTAITIPNSVKSIGNSTFRGCTGLTSIDIPDSVTSIGDFTFYNCSRLTSCTIGSGVTSIGSEVFYSCVKMLTITSLATTAPTITSTTFNYIKSNGTLYVPIGSSGYDTWMRLSTYYLGYYNWTKVEQ